jgi:hypothetical protein
MKALLLALGALLLLASVVGAQAGSSPSTSTALGTGSAGYDLAWWTVDGGGAAFGTVNGYTLAGTSGQPDAGVLHDGGYVLTGGFWVGGAAAAPWHYIYLPLVLRNF